MRTTLDIAEDVLSAAKERARRENKTTGEVVMRALLDVNVLGDGRSQGFHETRLRLDPPAGTRTP